MKTDPLLEKTLRLRAQRAEVEKREKVTRDALRSLRVAARAAFLVEIGERARRANLEGRDDAVVERFLGIAR